MTPRLLDHLVWAYERAREQMSALGRCCRTTFSTASVNVRFRQLRTSPCTRSGRLCANNRLHGLFDDLVSKGNQGIRKLQPERLRCPEVDDKLKLVGCSTECRLAWRP